MRLLFINPNLRPGHPTRYLPVGLAYVMTAVEQAGYEFDLLDIGLEDQSDAEVEAYLESGSWDVVLTGSIVTHYRWMKWLTRAVRERQPQATIVVGNSVAGSIPELMLERSETDVVVVGEGEQTTVELLGAIRAGRPLTEVPGLVVRDDQGRAVHGARRPGAAIDSFTPPRWELFDLDGYFARTDSASAYGVRDDGRSWRTLPVVTARGCVFQCSFCHIVYKHDPYRHRCAEAILAEARRGIERHGANYINFWDDLTFYKLSQAEKIVDGILASGLEFYWSAAVRTDLFGNPKIPLEKRREVARKFKEAGCLTLGYSLESGNREILELMKKRVEPAFFEEQVRILDEVGITSNTSVVFGYPIETRETMRQTFELCERSGIYPSIGFLLPLPDTEMYSHAREHGYIRDEDAFLDSITERQDICLNMTAMEDAEILDEIRRGCDRLNRSLELGLSEERYIRTGGYRKHTRVGEAAPADSRTAPAEPGLGLSYSSQRFGSG